MNKIKILFVNILHHLIISVVSVMCLAMPIFGDKDSLINYSINWALFFLGMGLLTMLFNSFFTGKRFDRLFKSKLIDDKYINSELYTPLFSGNLIIYIRSIRAILYSFCMVFPRWSNRIYSYRSWFEGYNFRKNSKWIDLLLSYLFQACIFLFLLLLCTTAIIKLTTWL